MYTIINNLCRHRRIIDMNIKDKNITVKKGRGFPLGVTSHADDVQFSFVYDKKEPLELLIYKRNKKKPELRLKIDYKDYVKGNVISFILSAPNLSDTLAGDCEYALYCGGKRIDDPYAARVAGRERFGKCTDMLRYGFDFHEYDWTGEDRPDIDYDSLMIYRLHIRGFTRDVSSGVSSRGTYEGVLEKADYIKDLGFNAVLLLPAYEFNEIMKEDGAYGVPQNVMHAGYDKDAGLRLNYWGYTEDCAYFAPKASYADEPSECVASFKNMVKTLHNAGIMVFMDMHFGCGMPYYMISDCLRSWAYNYHIDGFRINDIIVPQKLITLDYTLRSVRFITNYWDRRDAYGNLADFNDGSLINIRRFILGEEGQAEEYVRRFISGGDGISDIRYVADINGFTLMDTVSYDRKHNEDNGENGLDGTDYNYSSGYGEEGPTRKKRIYEIRKAQIKNALLLLFMTQGVPMLLSGDEFGNSQKGNNNAYCQDNKISWLDWKRIDVNGWLVSFVKELAAFRQKYHVADKSAEVTFHGVLPWIADHSPGCRTAGIMLRPQGIYIAINMDRYDTQFRLPAPDKNMRWQEKLYSRSIEGVRIENDQYICNVPAQTVVVFVSE